MRHKILFAASLLALSAFSAPVLAGEMPGGIKTGQSTLGQVLTDSKGMTLYKLDPDPAGKSVCNGKCAQNWPPLMAQGNSASDGDFTIVVREDGGKQWAHRGKPLYAWFKDQKPGDTTGHGLGGKWTAAQP